MKIISIYKKIAIYSVFEVLFYSDFCTKLFRVYLYSFCKEDKSNLKNLDYFLRNHKFENDETLLFTMVEDNSFENLKIIVLCS